MKAPAPRAAHVQAALAATAAQAKLAPAPAAPPRPAAHVQAAQAAVQARFPTPPRSQPAPLSQPSRPAPPPPPPLPRRAAPPAPAPPRRPGLAIQPSPAIQCMKLGKNPLAFQATFKYSERQDVVWAMVELSNDVHISFYPHGPGAEDYKKKLLGIISDWAQDYGPWSARNLEWFKLWMLNDLPFDLFHVTVQGNHFYFSEDGTVLGESAANGKITSEQRIAAWKASGYALTGVQRVWPPVYNFSQNPNDYKTSSFPNSSQVYEGVFEHNPYSPSWPKMEWSAKEQSFSFKD